MTWWGSGCREGGDNWKVVVKFRRWCLIERKMVKAVKVSGDRGRAKKQRSEVDYEKEQKGRGIDCRVR